MDIAHQAQHRLALHAEVVLVDIMGVIHHTPLPTLGLGVVASPLVRESRDGRLQVHQ